jgi:multidrug efflux pump subunit AcrA (membrane-fusion protein)
MALRSRALVCSLLIAAATLFGAAKVASRPDHHHSVRATGVVRAVNSITVMVPRIEGQGGNLTLATLAENGATVAVGDSLATFDRSNELKLLREAETKFDDLEHQIEEKKAEHLSNAEKRVSDLQQAEADLKKAEIETRKGPVRDRTGEESGQSCRRPGACGEPSTVQPVTRCRGTG